MVGRVRAVVVATALAGVALAGCSSGQDDTSPTVVLGTWTGQAGYADPAGEAKGGAETLVIERQEGALLWGYTAYIDSDGTEVKTGVTGTLTGDDGIVLTEEGTLWQGELDGDSATFVVSWQKGAKDHSAFEMTMTKQQ